MAAIDAGIGLGEIGKVCQESCVYNDVKERLYGIKARYNRPETIKKKELCGEEFGIRVQMPMGPHIGCFIESWRKVAKSEDDQPEIKHVIYGPDGKQVLFDENFEKVSALQYAKTTDNTLKGGLEYADRMLEQHLQAAMAIGNLKEEKTLLLTPWIRMELWTDWRSYHRCSLAETKKIIQDPDQAPWLEKDSDFMKFHNNRLSTVYKEKEIGEELS